MTLILKHANKNRLGAIDWGQNDFDVCVSDHASKVEIVKYRGDGGDIS